MNEKRLADLPLFEGMDDEALRTVSKVAQEVSVSEGAELVREGDYSYELSIIDEGQAEVMHEGQVVATLGPGRRLRRVGRAQQEHAQRRRPGHDAHAAHHAHRLGPASPAHAHPPAGGARLGARRRAREVTRRPERAPDAHRARGRAGDRVQRGPRRAVGDRARDVGVLPLRVGGAVAGAPRLARAPQARPARDPLAQDVRRRERSSRRTSSCTTTRSTWSAPAWRPCSATCRSSWSPTSPGRS